MSNIFHERRLCHQHGGGAAPSSAPGSAPGRNFIDRLRVFGSDIFDEASELLRSVPQVERYMSGKEEARQREILERLVDHANWINVFLQYPQLLEEENPPVITARSDGEREVVEFMRTLPLSERRQIYIEHVDRFIPRAVQDRYTDMFRPEEGDVQARYRAISAAGLSQTVMRTVGGTLGIGVEGLDARERNIAGESLAHAYNLEGVDTSSADFMPSQPLFADFRDAMRLQQLHGFRPAVTSPERLQASLERVGPSRFLGALKLGIVDQPVLEHLGENLRTIETELARVATGASRQVDDLSGQTREHMREQAMGMRDVWRNMGGGEKLVLLGAAMFMLFSKRMRGLVLGAVALYFGYKFWNKGKSPFDAIDDMRRKIDAGEKPITELGREAEIFAEFLSDQDKENLETEVSAFLILKKIPLNLLAKHYHDDSLHIDELKKDVGSDLIPQKVLRWFEAQNEATGTTNLETINEALSSVFYYLASEDPANNDLDTIVKNAVEKEGEFPPHDVNARAAYDDLVTRGRGKSGSATLGSYIADIIRRRAVVPEDVEQTPSMAERLFHRDPVLQEKVREWEEQNWRFEIVDGPGVSKWLKALSPPGAAGSRIGMLREQSRRVFYASIDEAGMVVQAANIQTELESRMRGVMGMGIIRDGFTLPGLKAQLEEVGGPAIILSTPVYDDARRVVVVTIEGAGTLAIPADVWLEQVLEQGKPPAQIIAERSVQLVPAHPSVMALSPDIDAAWNTELTAMEGRGELGAWTASALRMVLRNEHRFRSGILQAIYHAYVAGAGSGSLPDQMRAVQRLAERDGAGHAVNHALKSVGNASVRLVSEGPDRFVPIYAFTVEFADGRTEKREVRIDRQEIDKNSI